MDLPAAASTWHFRLYWSKDASLGIDAEALTGGDSIPLTLDPKGLSRDLKTAVSAVGRRTTHCD